MLPPLEFLRERAGEILHCKQAQGFDIRGLRVELKELPDSYDALAAFEAKLQALPFLEDWPYVEPIDLKEIWAECDPQRPPGPIGNLTAEDAAARTRAAFEAAVAGCMLGKPTEVDPTLDELKACLEAVDAWPLDFYFSEAALKVLGREHPTTPTTCRENIQFVTRDDDINYDLTGMLMIEEHGADFTRKDLIQCWLEQLPIMMTYGPERTCLLKAGLQSFGWRFDGEGLAAGWNSKDEACGAAIRVDAYGYACAGNPALAAELAWRDAGMTHVRTGVYSAMFVAAAIATAYVADNPMEIAQTAIMYVPQKSRFHEVMADCIEMVLGADDWVDGYRKVNGKYGEYRHCQVYQECGHLINTMRFAKTAEEAICMQVSQGADTDCFGEIIGSIMGAYFGPGTLPAKWIDIFNDDFRCGLAQFYERSLNKVTDRMAALPGVIMKG